LVVALRAHAVGLLCVVAAVELLIGHAMWLRRNDFVDEFVQAVDESAAGTARGMSWAWVDWAAALAALDAGGLPCSGGEAAVLRVAVSLAEGIPVDLGEVVSCLDARNLELVAQAVRRAGGVVAAAGVGERR
jgi:hypothetical protein